MEPRQVDVENICYNSARVVRGLAQERRITLALRLDVSVTTIRADEQRLKQILVSLLTQTIRLTPVGGSIGLQVQGDQAQGRVQLIVWGSEITLSPEEQQQLLRSSVGIGGQVEEPGQQLVASLTGLHGGTISVKHEPGKGSRFTITMPWGAVAHRSVPAALGVDAEPPVAEPDQTRSQARILVVDDNPTGRDVVAAYLRGRGYRVDIATNGYEAITQASSLEPSLILMDIQMPDMDGIEAMKRLRANPALAKIPIIALTALAMQGDRERCLEAGADRYLSKPVPLRQIAELIETELATPH
jgi:CheY-like chemotaxis protein